MIDLVWLFQKKKCHLIKIILFISINIRGEKCKNKNVTTVIFILYQ